MYAAEANSFNVLPLLIARDYEPVKGVLNPLMLAASVNSYKSCKIIADVARVSRSILVEG